MPQILDFSVDFIDPESRTVECKTVLRFLLTKAVCTYEKCELLLRNGGEGYLVWVAQTETIAIPFSLTRIDPNSMKSQPGNLRRCYPF